MCVGGVSVVTSDIPENFLLFSFVVGKIEPAYVRQLSHLVLKVPTET